LKGDARNLTHSIATLVLTTGSSAGLMARELGVACMVAEGATQNQHPAPALIALQDWTNGQYSGRRRSVIGVAYTKTGLVTIAMTVWTIGRPAGPWARRIGAVGISTRVVRRNCIQRLAQLRRWLLYQSVWLQRANVNGVAAIRTCCAMWSSRGPPLLIVMRISTIGPWHGQMGRRPGAACTGAVAATRMIRRRVVGIG